MRLAQLVCPGCRTSYETAIEKEAFVAACPTCGQNNRIPGTAKPITGCCPVCSKPLDDHGFEGGELRACPSERVPKT